MRQGMEMEVPISPKVDEAAAYSVRTLARAIACALVLWHLPDLITAVRWW